MSERAPLRRTLRLSSADGMCCSAMVGMGETYFCAFLLAVGKSGTVAGLVGSVPLLIGAILQLATPRLMQRSGSHRTWVVGSALMQTAMLALLIAYAWMGNIGTLSAFALIAIYYAASQASGTGWNPWIERLVPARVRPRYFAGRNRLVQLAQMAGLFGAGVVLDRLTSKTGALVAFSVVFGAAVGMRLLSTAFMWRQPDVSTDAATTKTLSVHDFFERLRVREDGRIMRYVLGVQTAVYLASPYFTPFMLDKLHLPYGAYMLLTAAMFGGKIVIYPLCARVIEAHGPRRLLWLGGLGMTLLPLPWVVSGNFTVLIAAQLASGMAWGAFETATFFLYLKHVPNAERTAMMSMFNVCNAFAMVLGSGLGAALLAVMGGTKLAYLVVFAVSTLGRAATALVLRGIEPTPVHHVVPIAFALVRPTLAAPRVIAMSLRRRVRLSPPPNRPQLRSRRGTPKRRSA